MQQHRDEQHEKSGPGAIWPHGLLEWPFAFAQLAVEAGLWWLDRDRPPPKPRGPESSLPWTTPNAVALELCSMRLRNFSRHAAGQPAVICAPYALHRAQIADFAPGHSVVASLQAGGIDRVYLTDWRSASPDMRYLSIDSYLSDLNVAVDEIGPPVDLIGLCQGGWLSLLYAARFPHKVRRLVLVGAPVDLSVRSALSQLVLDAPQLVFDQLVARGGGNVSGPEMLSLWTRSLSPHDIQVALQVAADAPHGSELLRRFREWNQDTLDLPGAYYLQIVNWIFRENRIATGKFVALGRTIHLETIKTPVFVLVGQDDDVVPPAQGLATLRLLGTQPPFAESAIEASNHLGLFMGARTHAISWPRIAGWLQSDLAGLRPRSIPA